MEINSAFMECLASTPGRTIMIIIGYKLRRIKRLTSLQNIKFRISISAVWWCKICDSLTLGIWHSDTTCFTNLYTCFQPKVIIFMFIQAHFGGSSLIKTAISCLLRHDTLSVGYVRPGNTMVVLSQRKLGIGKPEIRFKGHTFVYGPHEIRVFACMHICVHERQA